MGRSAVAVRPFALAAGVAMKWAFDPLVEHRGSQSILSGVQFDAVMYVTLLPSAALDSLIAGAAVSWLLADRES